MFRIKLEFCGSYQRNGFKEILLRDFLFSINNKRVRKKYLKKQAQHIYIRKKTESSQNSYWICFKFKDKVG